VIDIRCRNHLHHRAEPEREIVHIFCAQCSRKRKQPVFHQYTRDEARAALRDHQDVLWVDR